MRSSSTRERVLAAGNPALSPSDRQSIASDLCSQFDATLAIANTRDANGDYLFAGYRSNTPPFEKTVTAGTPGSDYKGDQGSRTM